MFHNTYDRLQGSWWGGIGAQQSLGLSVGDRELSDLYRQPWLVKRQKLATLLLQQEFEPPTDFSLDSRELLAYLPAIVFSTASAPSLTSILPLVPTSSTAEIAIEQQILTWANLLTGVLNHRSTSSAQDRLTKLAILTPPTANSLLAEQLKLVSELAARGASLNLVEEQLSAATASRAIAISLAWYCFITTPHDFNLSIRKAAQSSPNLASLTVALTGTLSGAYNGMAEISRYWRTDRYNSQSQTEQHLFHQLFALWSGVYATQTHFHGFNPHLNMVALPETIQPRFRVNVTPLD